MPPKALLPALAALCLGRASALPNFLVVVVDDFSPLFVPDESLTPNVARLMERGMAYSNAFTTFPVCGPSRQSFMSGRWADSTQIWTFERWLPSAHPSLMTIGKYFKDVLGYTTMGIGKVYHDAMTSRFVIGQGQVWYENGHWSKPNQAQYLSDDTECGGGWACGLPTAKLCDTRIASAAARFLTKPMAANSPPFALFVGLRRPHENLAMPTAYLKAAPTNIRAPNLAQPQSINRNLVPVDFTSSLMRFQCWNEVYGRFVELGGKSSTRMDLDPITRFATNSALGNYLSFMRQAYAGAVQWMDSRLGVILDALDGSVHANNTVIIFFSDHGYAIGEHTLFCKNALFEQHTRVPLIIVPPGPVSSANAKRSSDPVSLINVFPTMVDFATGTDPGQKATIDKSGLPLDGMSLRNPAMRSAYAFMQYPRCENISYHAKCVSDVGTACGRVPITWMGYSVKSLDLVRYVEWRPFHEVDLGCFPPSWPQDSAFLTLQFGPVVEINPNKTGTQWSLGVEQRELFDDYISANGTDNYEQWEQDNALLRGGNTTAALVIRALEHSTAIRWNFDPYFVNPPSLPCNNHGMVRLKTPSEWKALNQMPEPARTDVICECLPGWTGTECNTLVG